jgi:hypothetical protein
MGYIWLFLLSLLAYGHTNGLDMNLKLDTKSPKFKNKEISQISGDE